MKLMEDGKCKSAMRNIIYAHDTAFLSLPSSLFLSFPSSFSLLFSGTFPITFPTLLAPVTSRDEIPPSHSLSSWKSWLLKLKPHNISTMFVVLLSYQVCLYRTCDSHWHVRSVGKESFPSEQLTSDVILMLPTQDLVYVMSCICGTHHMRCTSKIFPNFAQCKLMLQKLGCMVVCPWEERTKIFTFLLI